MPHILATYHGLEKDLIEDMIHDLTRHHKHDLYVEHLWQNADDDDEVIFLFKTDDLDGAKHILDRVHTESLKHNTNINPPKVVYLKK